MKRRLAWILLALLAGCGKSGDELAGTNSSTETGELAGLLVLRGGTAAPGATVTLSPAGTATSKRSARSRAAGAASGAAFDTVVTDDAGHYSFIHLDSGVYDLAATLIKDGDTLVAFRFDIPFGKTLFVGTDTLVAPGKIQVRATAGGNPVEGVTCYIPGTSFIAISDAEGKCVISGIEPGTYDVAFLHPIYIGDRITGVEVLSGSKKALPDEALRADPAKPPPAPQGLSAAYDKATGAVILRWDSVRVSDLDGYLLFRDTAASVVPTRLTPVLKETVFRDSAFGDLQDTSARTLYYRVQAQDKDGNASLFALFPPLRVTRPLLPASPSPADGASGVDTSALLAWAPVAGAKSYSFYLSSGARADSLAVAGLAAASFHPAGLRTSTHYRWKVSARFDGDSAAGPEWSFTTRGPDTVVIPPGPFRDAGYSETQVFDSALALEMDLSFYEKTFELKLFKRSRVDKSFQGGSVYAGNTLLAANDTLILESLYKRALKGANTLDTAVPGVDTNDIPCGYTWDAEKAQLHLECQGRAWNLSKFATGPEPRLLTGNYRGVAPKILIQPVSVTVHPGDSAVITVTASGTPDLKFKWTQGGASPCVPVNTATTSRCVIRDLALEDNGIAVQVTVSNPAGSVQSEAASVTVKKQSLPNVVVSVDSPQPPGDLGVESDVAIGADGFPVIAYRDDFSNYDLKVAKCGNASCTSGNVITTVDGGAQQAGRFSSVAVPPDGRPVISYQYNDVRILVVKCGNAACSSGNVTTTVDSGDGGDYVGMYTSLAVPPDGLPVVAYHGVNGLTVVKCGNAACSSDVTRKAVDGADAEYVSMALAADGYPVMSYYDAYNRNLKVAKCGDAACSSGNVATLIDAPGDVGKYSALAVPSDGKPVVAYYDVDKTNLKILKCGDAQCLAGNSVTAADSIGDVGSHASIALASDGLPLVAYVDAGKHLVKVMKCGDAACSAGNTFSVAAGGDGTLRPGDLSLIVPADKKPIISFFEENDQNLKTVKCGQVDCAE